MKTWDYGLAHPGNKVRYEPWHVVRVCVQCDYEFGVSEDARTGGVCPECGRVSSGTVCDTHKHARRYIYVKPRGFWNFFRLASVYQEIRMYLEL